MKKLRLNNLVSQGKQADVSKLFSSGSAFLFTYPGEITYLPIMSSLSLWASLALGGTDKPLARRDTKSIPRTYPTSFARSKNREASWMMVPKATDRLSFTGTFITVNFLKCIHFFLPWAEEKERQYPSRGPPPPASASPRSWTQGAPVVLREVCRHKPVVVPCGQPHTAPCHNSAIIQPSQGLYELLQGGHADSLPTASHSASAEHLLCARLWASQTVLEIQST